MGCLRPKPTDYLPILEGILHTELRRQEATPSLAHRNVMYPNHLLNQWLGPPPSTKKDHNLDSLCVCSTQAAQ